MATVVTFGELMLRLKSPGFQRFIQSACLESTFGGGEANVAVSLSQFGHQTRFVSAFPANPDQTVDMHLLDPVNVTANTR